MNIYMKKIFFLLFLIVSCNVFAQDKKLPVVIDGDEITYLREEGKLVARGNVSVKYKGADLFCDEMEYDNNINVAYIKGNVKIVRGNSVLSGEDAVYDFNSQNAQITAVRIEDPPVFGEAKEGDKLGQEKYVLRNGYATTCDLEVPHYRLVSKRVIIYPNERVTAKNMILKVGKVPIFYFPYFSQSLKDKSFLAELSPGKDKEWGSYILTRWRYWMNNENKGKIHLDWYDRRGLGTGVSHKLETKNFGEALINYYHIEDSLYSLGDRYALYDYFPERENIVSKYLEDDRFKGQFSYDWKPKPNLSVKAEFNKFSDAFFMKDFFEREYEIQPHPLSYVLVNHSLPGASLSLLTQKRANHFFTETEYLPQLEYAFYRKNLGSSKFYFQSNDKMSNLNLKRANSDLDDDAWRALSYNTLSYIDKIKWLSISPYIGSYTNFYSKNRFADDYIWRVAPVAGASLSTKLYKYFDIGKNVFGEKIDKMRHILTPELNYSYIHDPTVSNNHLFQFDSDDSLLRDEKVIFALKNKLQAKNQEKIWDFVYFSPSVEYRIDEERLGTYFDNVKADLEFYPGEGFSLKADTTYLINRYSRNRKRITEANVDLTVSGRTKIFGGGEDTDKGKYSVSVGQRYTRRDSTMGILDLTYQLTPRLQFKNYTRYEYNTGDFEKQQYVLRADLHCWWMDLGLDLDRHVRGGKDLTFWVIFKLKAFPDIDVGFEHGYTGAKKP